MLELSLCPVCESGRWGRVLRAEGFEVARCLTCTLARTVPAPRESDGREHFSGDYAYYKGFYTEQKELRYRFAARTLGIVREFKDAGRILDIGCGIGFFVDYAARHGYECVGIDTSPAATRFAREELNLNVLTADFIAESFQTLDAFDVVTLNHVLEHISSPLPFLMKVGRVLKRDGIVISSSPNFAGLLPRLLKRRWYGLQPLQHVWQFSPKSYKALFDKAGFIVQRVSVESMHYAPGPDWRATVIYCLAELSKAVGQGDNVSLVGGK